MLEPEGRCPVCGNGLGGVLCACPRCETPHHQECWDWAGGCAIFGCASLPAVVPERRPAQPRALPASELALTTNVAERVFDGDWDTLVEAFRAIPRSAMPWWWVWNTAALAAMFGAAIALCMITGLSGVIVRLIIEIGLRAFPIIGPILAGLVFLPLALLRVEWRFLPDEHEITQRLSMAGVTLFSRRWSFAEVLRVELRERGRLAKLVMIRADGASVDLSHMQGSGLERAGNLQALARGLQEHTALHVTPELRADPVAMVKRLETLKLAAAEAKPGAVAVKRASLVPLGVALGGLGGWLILAAPLTAPALVAWMLGSALLWPIIAKAARGWSLAEGNAGSLLALAVIAAGIALTVNVGAVGLALMVVSGLAGAAGIALDNAIDRNPLDGAENGLTPAHLPELEHDLLGRHPDGTAAALATSGHLALAGVIALLLGLCAWFKLGVVVGSLVVLLPAVGAALEAMAWTRARALDRLVARSAVVHPQLTEDASSGEHIENRPV